MSAKSQPEDRRHRSAGDEVLQRLDDLNGSLMDRIDIDDRFQSGVPDGQRSTDLEFILMSGLTRPVPEGLLPADNPPPGSNNLGRSLSFFEHGVADVDDQLAPATIDSEPVNDEVLDADPIPMYKPARTESNIVEMHEVAADEPPDASGIEGPEVRFAPSPMDLEEVFEGISAPVEQEAGHLPDTRESDLDEPESPDLEQVSEMAGVPTPDIGDVAEQQDPANESELPASEPKPAGIQSSAEAHVPNSESDDEVSQLIDHYLRSARRNESEQPASPELDAVPDMVVEQAPPSPVPVPLEENTPALTGENADVPPEVVPENNPVERPLVADLATAELFLQALETQPRDRQSPIPDPTPEPMAQPESTKSVEADAPELDELEALTATEELPVRDAMSSRSGRRSRRSQSRTKRRVIRLVWTGVAAVVALMVLAGGYLWIQSALTTPEARFAEAQQLAAVGMYSQASTMLAAFAAANPRHPSRPEAQFLAALYAQMAPTSDFDAEQVVARQALVLFGEFLRDNPTHPKAPRAQTMAAQLHYRLEQYQEAVNILRDPMLRLRDAESALPGLRTLARSYVRLGEHAAAESAYQQAAAWAGNFTPDADYDELGDLFKLRADRADDLNAARLLREAAIENWDHAIRVPGIDPANKAKIQDKKKWLESQLGEPQATASETAVEEVTPTAVAESDPPAELPAPAVSTDPQAEARFLSGSPGTEAAQ